MALSEAIIATYMTIHMARSPGSHKERIAASYQELQEGSEILRLWLSGNETAAGSCKGVGIRFWELEPRWSVTAEHA